MTESTLRMVSSVLCKKAQCWRCQRFAISMSLWRLCGSCRRESAKAKDPLDIEFFRPLLDGGCGVDRVRSCRSSGLVESLRTAHLVVGATEEQVSGQTNTLKIEDRTTYLNHARLDDVW